MAEAAVLVGGYLKRTTGFTGKGFNHKSGFLVKFISNGIPYIHVNSINFRSEDQNSVYATAGYYDESKFLKYKAKEILLEELPKYMLNQKAIEDGVIDDVVNVRKLKVVEPFTDFCKVYDISWVYTGTTILDPESNISIPPPPISTTITTNVPVHEVSQGFYQHNIPLIVNPNIPGDQRPAAALIIAKVALQINNIQRDIFPLFVGDPEFSAYITSQNLEWRTSAIFLNPYIKELQSYLDRITEFYNSLYANQISLQKAKSDVKLYWMGYVLSIEALVVVPAYDKVKILDVVAKGTILGETSKFIVNAINEEELVVKVIKSTASGQEDDLLNGLINSRYPNGKKTKGGESNTLFQLLYDKINDSGIGAENLKTLIGELHKIWMRSSFFPYNVDGTVKDSLINPAIYASKPIYLGYESGTILWAFNTSNYNFTFNSSKIVVTEPTDQITESGVTSNDVVIGSYGIYQTITIKNTDSNTNNTKFLSVNINGDQQAALPMFYLKYIDDKKSTENLVTQIELTFDLALTLTGIGNLAKLRHVRSVFRLGRVALGLEAAAGGEILVTYELAQGVAGAIEITGSLASIFINYAKNYKNTYCEVSSPSYNLAKCNFYTKLDNIFLVMQLFSGVLDIVTSRQLQKAAQDLLSGPIPSDFDPDALIILLKFSGGIEGLKTIFNARLIQRYGNDSPIWKKINNAVGDGGLSDIKKEEFIIDFEKADDAVLDGLNANNGDLIEYWSTNPLKAERRRIEYLDIFRRFKNSDELTKHITLGDLNPRLGIPASSLPAKKTFAANGFPNIINYEASGVHTLRPPIPSDIMFVGVSKGPNELGYFKAKIRKKPGNGWENPSDTSVTKSWTRIKETTCFPNTWDEDKILSELALAFKNRIRKNGLLQDNGNYLFKGYMGDGVQVTILVRPDNVIDSAYPNVNF